MEVVVIVNKSVLIAFWPPKRWPNLPLRRQLHENTTNASFTTISTTGGDVSTCTSGRVTMLRSLLGHGAPTALTWNEEAVPRHNKVDARAFHLASFTTISTNSSIPSKTTKGGAGGLRTQMYRLFPARHRVVCESDHQEAPSAARILPLLARPAAKVPQPGPSSGIQDLCRWLSSLR